VARLVLFLQSLDVADRSWSGKVWNMYLVYVDFGKARKWSSAGWNGSFEAGQYIVR
jgi:hypothetical protein